jgi:hypothetical protein
MELIPFLVRADAGGPVLDLSPRVKREGDKGIDSRPVIEGLTLPLLAGAAGAFSRIPLKGSGGSCNGLGIGDTGVVGYLVGLVNLIYLDILDINDGWFFDELMVNFGGYKSTCKLLAHLWVSPFHQGREFSEPGAVQGEDLVDPFFLSFFSIQVSDFSVLGRIYEREKLLSIDVLGRQVVEDDHSNILGIVAPSMWLMTSVFPFFPLQT